MVRGRWWQGLERVALALCVLGAVACGTLSREAGHRVYSPPEYGIDRFVLVRGYTIHYVEAGQGRPLLLIPGAFTTYRTWNRVLPRLMLHNRVLAVDYLGVGDSDKPEEGFGYTVAEQADVMAELIRSLGLSRINVMGASYGGAVALNLAARYPDLVERVVCIEGGALITPELLNYSRLGALVQWPVLGDIIWGFMQSGLFDEVSARSIMGRAWDELSPAARQEVVGVFSANIHTVSRASWTGIYRAITSRIDFTEILDRTRVPTLYLYGEDSKYRAVAEVNARHFERHNPNIEIVALRGAVHDLHLQYPGEVARIVQRFLGPTPVDRIVARRGRSAGDGVGRVVLPPWLDRGVRGRELATRPPGEGVGPR
jgi:pimeloyl-ACP methyl ester carboxylesterase